MIQSVQDRNIGTSGSDANASANFVGKCTAFHTFISYFTTITFKFWIIDSGSSQHMTHDKTLLNNFKQLPFPIQVTLPNSYKVKVYSLGSVLISPEIELHNVLYIPFFNHNLLFVNQLCKQLISNILFTKSECLVQAPSLKRQMVLGEAFAGFYVLEVDSTKSRVSKSDPVSIEPLFPFPKNHVKTCSAANSEFFVQSCSSDPESTQTSVRGIFPSNESLNMKNVSVSDL